MRDLWTLPAIAKWEKSCGKHPTQKPLPLLARIILASTKENAWILDPFTGSSTTGIAASLLNRRFLGIDRETEFLKLSKARREEIENPQIRQNYREKILKYSDKPIRGIVEIREDTPYFGGRPAVLGFFNFSLHSGKAKAPQSTRTPHPFRSAILNLNHNFPSYPANRGSAFRLHCCTPRISVPQRPAPPLMSGVSFPFKPFINAFFSNLP